MRLTTALALWMTVCVSGAHGEDSREVRVADIAVAPPRIERFINIEPPPGDFIVLWQSSSDGVNMGVLVTEVPSNLVFERGGVEEGLCEAIGGTIVSSEETVLADIPIFTMVAKGTANGHATYWMQRVLGRSVNGKAIKVIASSPEHDVSEDLDVQRFMASLRVLGDHRAKHVNPDVDKDWVTWISTNVGGASVLLLLVCLVVWLMQRNIRRMRTGQGHEVIAAELASDSNEIPPRRRDPP